LSETSLAEALEACTQRCLVSDAPLAERLRQLAEDVNALSPEFAAIVNRMVGRLQSAAAGAGAPAVGEPMPPFVLPNQDGKLVSLEKLLEQGPAVVSFHRGHWCPYCRISADALARIEPEVKAAGGVIVLVTPEVQKFTRELKADAKAAFPILTDIDNGYALALQLAIRINEEKREAMTAAGWDIAPYNDSDSWTLPIPATFVVGTDGRIKGRFVDPDYRKRMDIEDLLAALKS
jgi:peroxiredoxin